MNRQALRTRGESIVHVSEIHSAIETDRGIYQHLRRELFAVQRQIGTHVVAPVEDGATLQLGFEVFGIRLTA